MKILLPTDHSENSLKAVCYVMELFGPGHEWSLLNTYGTPHVGAGMMVKIDDIISKQSEEDLQEFADKLQAKLNAEEYPAELYSEQGQVQQCIDSHCEQYEYDLIALGTTGATGLKEVLMGSVAAKVVEHSKVPVLAIPANAEYSGLSKLALADDLGPVNNTDSIGIVHWLIDQHRPQLMAVHVSPKDVEFGQDNSGLGVHFSEQGIQYHVVNNPDIASGLQTFNQENDVDLLVMLQRKESAFLKWLIVSTSEEMAMHARRPILVLKD